MATTASARGVLAAILIAATACAAAPEPAKTLALTRPSAQAPFDGTFSWTPLPAAKTYNVVVFAFDGSRAFEVRDLTSAGVKLGEGVRLPPGPYSVQVTAMRDGETVSESPRTEFQIK